MADVAPVERPSSSEHQQPPQPMKRSPSDDGFVDEFYQLVDAWLAAYPIDTDAVKESSVRFAADPGTRPKTW